MDYITFLLLLSFVWTCIHLLKLSPIGRKPGTASLPPGPRPLPIIGNILKLGDKPHRSLANLSKTYGPVMSLKLGSIATIVISSSETAKEVLHRNDQAFSSRTVPDAVRAHNHHESSVVWVPASVHWRKIRKICTREIFSVQQLDASQGLRRKIVQELLDHVEECCSRGCAVDINGAVFTASLNLLSNTIFSINLAHHGSNFSQEFKNIARGVMEGVGRPNFVDYFPAFRLIDPQASKDVLDALLNLTKENDNEWSCSDIKHLLLDLFVAGTDTTSSTVEWAMAELLCNPEKIAKAQKEIRGVLGNEGIVQESDISKFPYLQSIVKETFRLHPPAPLLVPHKAETDVEICGFTIPKNSQVLVNAWAIGRDPSTWPNPNAFMPERFLECDIDVKGRDFELIPFGAGRRICPGMPLAHRMVHLMLASLLYSHAWKLEDGMKPENMDMSEKFGLTLQKAQPLRAIPIKV
ncbi:cytochrome P450 76T24 isoform X2 [Vitis vinifera]|uniref:Geraniol 8-hydroxylase n=1 Tax=Vitis vinifera TaxID=29760 RepID=A0A438E0G2_VITVI|nr:cytochrome P450 76T24 isoform X2 [Vitis vinifera]RVW41128.1 Geraniol 8-hydroxylase [Vitis vinifera]|eukprot:XP_002276121.1 PREDICTED: cytochrome P450 76AD1 isoform X2 [Vitis vinifera]